MLRVLAPEGGVFLVISHRARPSRKSKVSDSSASRRTQRASPSRFCYKMSQSGNATRPGYGRACDYGGTGPRARPDRRRPAPVLSEASDGDGRGRWSDTAPPGTLAGPVCIHRAVTGRFRPPVLKLPDPLLAAVPSALRRSAHKSNAPSPNSERARAVTCIGPTKPDISPDWGWRTRMKTLILAAVMTLGMAAIQLPQAAQAGASTAADHGPSLQNTNFWPSGSETEGGWG
jgi:hypothetical protein